MKNQKRQMVDVSQIKPKLTTVEKDNGHFHSSDEVSARHEP